MLGNYVFLLAGLGFVCLFSMLCGLFGMLVAGLIVGLWTIGIVFVLGLVWLAYCWWEAR